jgi:hypothetical protein
LETEEIANNNKRIKLLATCFIIFIEFTICNNHHRNSNYVPLQYSIISLRARFDISLRQLVLIEKIKHRIDNDEIVEIIARESKHRPGGSITGRDSIFVTNKRIIIRDPSILGARENVVSVSYDKITSIELEKGVFSSKIVVRAPGFAEDMESIPKKWLKKLLNM